jgi:hypothetical protein
MNRLVLPTYLEDSSRVLIAGAGGGFDVFAGLPIFVALRAMGKQVSLANLSFSFLAGTDAPEMLPGLYRVSAKTQTSTPSYFPEGILARFLKTQGIAADIFAFDKRGVRPIYQAYQHLVSELDLDAIVLVDGGTDILMRGDEAGLGTPAEDMVSLAAVSQLKVPTRSVVCLGFGVDAYHGVCHAHFLENVAALSQGEGFWGSSSLLASMPEVQMYLEAVSFSEEHMPQRSSIVNTSIASAIEGKFGDVHRTERTRSSELFINPLMAQYWAFDLGAVANRSLYLESLYATESIWDVQVVIEAMRADQQIRPAQAIPH